MNVDQDIVGRQYQAENFDELLDDLVTEIEALNYVVTRITNIDNIYNRREEGIDVVIGFKRYKIIEFCNLNNCSELISADLRSGVFMPVRFIVYQKLDETAIHIDFLKPTAFAALFNSEPLMRIATQIEEDMINMQEEMGF